MIITLDNGEVITVVAKRNNENNNLIEYFIGDLRIGVLETDVMADNILILQDTLDNELLNQIKDCINRLPREEIEKEADLSKAIDTYIEEFGEREEKPTKIATVELDDKEQEKTEEKEEVTEKDVTVKQTIELNERANDMHNLRKWFGLPQDVEKIGVIESYQMNNLRNKTDRGLDNSTTRYSLVAIGKDGTIKPLSQYIPDLEKRDSTGNNPRRETYQVDTEGKVEKDAVLTEYQFGSKIIQIDNREMGRIEINIGEEARNSTEAMSVQLRTENTTFATDTSTRSVIGEYERNGENTVEENIKEAERHPSPEKDEMDERDIDGDETTKSHVHVYDKVVLEDGTELTFEDLAKRWGFYKETGEPDGEYAREKYIEEQSKDIEKNPQEIVEQLDVEFEDPRIQNQR